jgi:hypothetical protein
MVLLLGLFWEHLLSSTNTQISQLIQNSSLWVVAGVSLLMVAFAIGVIVDFVADIIESLLCLFFKQPVYYLLTKKHWMGISLAHRSEILKMLCSYAALKYHPGDLFLGNDAERNINNSLYKVFHGYNSISKPRGIVDRVRNSFRHKIAINYLLQVTKNWCFIGCNNYQKEQIESFFELYIFSRNIALTLLCSLIIWACAVPSNLALALLPIPFVFALASYRYNLYYCRLMLGSLLAAKI